MLGTSLSQTIILGTIIANYFSLPQVLTCSGSKGISQLSISTPKALRIHELKYKNNQCKKNKIIQQILFIFSQN